MNWWALGLLWLAGINLRITVLAIPPLIPLIHQDLDLSEKAVGALGGLPVLMFAGGALFGSLLLARTGAVRALIAGLALTGAAGALRGMGPDTLVLFTMTGVMGLGIAIMQPAMPTFTGHWFRNQVGVATAAYVNGLLVGEIIGAALTTSIALPLARGSWGGALAIWSLPLLANILLLVWALKLGLVTRPGRKGTPATARWWPDWRDGAMIRCGLILGCAASIYFTSNAFLPDFLHATKRPHLVEASLVALNTGQLPASFLLLALGDRLAGKAWPLVSVGLLGAAGGAGLTFAASDTGMIFWSGVVGFVGAFILILTLALPPLLAPQENVHHFSAGIFVIGYFIAFLTPVISGALWDALHIPAIAFAPVGAAGVILALLATRLHFSRYRS